MLHVVDYGHISGCSDFGVECKITLDSGRRAHLDHIQGISYGPPPSLKVSELKAPPF